MKTSVMEVRDMLSVLSASGVEKRIGEVPGVESVTVNYAAGTATVRYDETHLDVADIKSDVRQSGFEEAPANPAAAPASTPPTLPVEASGTGADAKQSAKPAPAAASSSNSKASPDAGASEAAPTPAIDGGEKVKAP
jgi:Cu2+-exporting ATPase